MKPTARIINTARGPVINEKALVACLAETANRRRGLGCVRTRATTGAGTVRLPNVVIAPHLGSATIGDANQNGKHGRRKLSGSVVAGRASTESCESTRFMIESIAPLISLVTDHRGGDFPGRLALAGGEGNAARLSDRCLWSRCFIGN